MLISLHREILQLTLQCPFCRTRVYTVFYPSLLSLLPFLHCRAPFLLIEAGFPVISVWYPFALYTSHLGSRVQSCYLYFGLCST